MKKHMKILLCINYTFLAMIIYSCQPKEAVQPVTTSKYENFIKKYDLIPVTALPPNITPIKVKSIAEAVKLIQAFDKISIAATPQSSRSEKSARVARNGEVVYKKPQPYFDIRMLESISPVLQANVIYTYCTGDNSFLSAEIESFLRGIQAGISWEQGTISYASASPTRVKWLLSGRLILGIELEGVGTTLRTSFISASSEFSNQVIFSEPDGDFTDCGDKDVNPDDWTPQASNPRQSPLLSSPNPYSGIPRVPNGPSGGGGGGISPTPPQEVPVTGGGGPGREPMIVYYTPPAETVPVEPRNDQGAQPGEPEPTQGRTAPRKPQL